MRFPFSLPTAAAATVLLACAATGSSVRADLVTFYGIDPGAGPTTARPNAEAARDRFDAALAALSLASGTLTFENQPTGGFDFISPAPGVTLSQFNAELGGIRASAGDATSGYNTTPGGQRYLQFWASATPATMRFSFATPVQGFGAYFTGLGSLSSSLFVEFNNGAGNQELAVPGNVAGGALFFGFTDAGRPISSVALRLRTGPNDIFGVDDVRFATAIPEPGTLALLLGGVLPLANVLAQRRRRRNR